MSVLRTLRTVLAAFFGVRGHRSAERDRQISPRDIILTALLLVLCLIVLLVLAVRWVAG